MKDKFTWHYLARELPPKGKPILIMSVKWGVIQRYRVVEKWDRNDDYTCMAYRRNTQYEYWTEIPKIKEEERDDPQLEIERHNEYMDYVMENCFEDGKDPDWYKHY